MNPRTWLARRIEWRCVCGHPPYPHTKYAGSYGICMRYRPAPPSKADSTDLWIYRLIWWAIGDDYRPELDHDVWIVPKASKATEDPDVVVRILDGGWIAAGESLTEPAQARRLAAMLLDAADRADRLADTQDAARIEWESL